MAEAAATGVDRWTILLAVGTAVLTILLGGVAASWVASRHDREERFRQLRIKACSEFLRAIARARMSLSAAELQAVVTNFVSLAGPDAGAAPRAETYRLQEEGQHAIDDAKLQHARLLLVFPDDSIADESQELLDAATLVHRRLESEFIEQLRDAEKRAKIPAQKTDSATEPQVPPVRPAERLARKLTAPNTARQAFARLDRAEKTFEKAARRVIHPKRRRKLRPR
jgi:type II secretory pathway pseudopilin PulG